MEPTQKPRSLKDILLALRQDPTYETFQSIKPELKAQTKDNKLIENDIVQIEEASDKPAVIKEKLIKDLHDLLFHPTLDPIQYEFGGLRRRRTRRHPKKRRVLRRRATRGRRA